MQPLPLCFLVLAQVPTTLTFTLVVDLAQYIVGYSYSICWSIQDFYSKKKKKKKKGYSGEALPLSFL